MGDRGRERATPGRRRKALRRYLILPILAIGGCYPLTHAHAEATLTASSAFGPGGPRVAVLLYEVASYR